MSFELFGPLFESSIVGGLTAVLLSYEHIKLENNIEKSKFSKRDIGLDLTKTKDLDKQKEIIKKQIKEELKENLEEKKIEIEPFILIAAIFFSVEIPMALGYICYILNIFPSITIGKILIDYQLDLSYLFIVIAYGLFLIAVLLLIWRIPQITELMITSKKIEKN